jgi:hypothetical protein
MRLKDRAVRKKREKKKEEGDYFSSSESNETGFRCGVATK